MLNYWELRRLSIRGLFRQLNFMSKLTLGGNKSVPIAMVSIWWGPNPGGCQHFPSHCTMVSGPMQATNRTNKPVLLDRLGTRYWSARAEMVP